MRLEDIGFYTLSDHRAKQASHTSPLWRCELLVTDKCNFNCPYCRRVGPKGHMKWADAKKIFDYWISEGLKNVRLSGGEPTLWPHISPAVRYLNKAGVERIAISTNGSADEDLYTELIDSGMSDFSISLDACCAGDVDKMTGTTGVWNKLCSNIEFIASKTYTTIGVVLTEENEHQINDIVLLASKLGVSDVRVIPAAQYSKALEVLPLSNMPILEYRRGNLKEGVRGLRAHDSCRCYLVLDDMAVIGDEHYPCIIYAREGGKAIGKIGSGTREERLRWSLEHDCHDDKICKNNCLDVCRDYNNTVEKIREGDILKGIFK